MQSREDILKTFRACIEPIAERLARNPDELFGFQVRDGVTFQGFEVFLGNRIVRVDPEKLKRVISLGRLETFCDHLYRNALRGKGLVPRDTHPYMRQDVLREIYFSYKRMLVKAIGQETTERFLDAVKEKILKAARVEEKLLHDATLYNQLVAKLESVVADIVGDKSKKIVLEKQYA